MAMARWSFQSLRTLLVLLVLLAVTPAFILIIYTASKQRRVAAAHVQDEALRIARMASSQQQRYIEGARQLLMALAKRPDVRHAQAGACTAAFADLLSSYPFYANLGAIRADGTTFCSALPFSGVLSASDRAYFQRAVAAREFAVGDYQVGRITKKATVNFGYPVLDAAGTVQGVVFAALDLAWLNRLASDTQLPAGSTLTVIDRDGTILVRYPDAENWVGRSASEAGILQPGLLAQGEGVTEARGPDGVERLVAFTPLSEVPVAGYAYVSIGIPSKTVLANANWMLGRNLAGLGLVGALALVAAWVGGDVFILRRVNALVKATQRLSAGDLGARTGLPSDESELGQLARAFDDMATSLQQQTDSMAFQATHDLLTQLPNRTIFREHLEQAIRVAQRGQTAVALLLLDINHFKEINNTLGHRNGDLLLRQVGPRLRRVLREPDLIANLGGDEFGVLLPDTDGRGAALVAQKVLDVFEESFVLEDVTVTVGAGIGIAVYPDHGDDADLLMQRADVAMHVAKEAGNEYFVYASDLDHSHPDRLALMGALRHAIDDNQLFLLYQPQVCVKTGRVVGVEALVRWRHPERGVIPPDQFILLAEHAGLIKPLTLWVLTTALRQCRVWHNLGIAISVAVNLSARSLKDAGLPDQVAAILHHAGVAPGSLELEITESAIMADPARALEILTRLNTMGVRLSIDDFGTGYSSLSYLKKLPVESIKIDKSFVMSMVTDQDDAVIVRSTIELAHTLGRKVVAEGVEQRETWDRLAALGCDVAQGYYLSRPQPADDLTPRLTESPWGVLRVST
ncbi:MAG: EAL domain-containing protein [Nitrospirae bacterium]|nr:EAL domain-containing protein [Nitrospirota bacterium]